MSKELALKSVNSDSLSKESLNLGEAITAFAKISRSEKVFKKALADPKTAEALGKTIATFVRFDLRMQGGMIGLGELCTNIEGMEEKAQRSAIAEICKANELEITEDIGRKGLAYAMFGMDKSALRVVPPNKDSKAGMKISSYKAAYKASKKVKHGGRETAAPTGEGTLPEDSSDKAPRSARLLFAAMYENSSAKEKGLLLKIGKRVHASIADWIPADQFEDEEGAD